MKRISNKTKIAVVGTAAACLVMGSSLAVFMDARTVAPATAAVGSVTINDIKMGIHEYQPGNGLEENHKFETPETGRQQILNVNPGDRNPLDITISNTGTKSVLTRTYLYVLLPKKDTMKAFRNYHLLITDFDGNYGKKDKLADITTRTKIKVNPGTASEKIQDFPAEYGRLNGQPAVRYTFGCIIDAEPTPDASAIETEPNSVAATRSVAPIRSEDYNKPANKQKRIGINEHKYELIFHSDSDIFYTDPIDYQFKSFTAAVQYRNTSDAEIEELMVDPNWTDDASWKK